jgi:hypothetical protein
MLANPEHEAAVKLTEKIKAKKKPITHPEHYNGAKKNGAR